MKSLSSSRREVLLDCFHVYTYHIGYLLPGSASTQHPAASLHNLSGHYPPAATNTPLLSRRHQACAGPLHNQLSFHLYQRAHDVEEEAAGGRACIDAIGQASEIYPAGLQLRDQSD